MSSSSKLYGIETEKALLNFGNNQLPEELIVAYAEVKKAALIAIQEVDRRFDDEVFTAILNACDRIIECKENVNFPIPLKQGGAGTSINMNMNEVIANLASKILFEKIGKTVQLDPIEDINCHQSTNDTFPTALTIIVYRLLLRIEKLVIELQDTLSQKENEYANIIITGRTEMQSALPMTLGQFYGSWAGAFERDRWRLNKLKERVRTISLGGTAIGTGFLAPQQYVFSAEKFLREITGLPLSRSQNLVDEISHQDKFAEVANGFNICAQNLFAMAGDFLLYTSSMVSEIILPRLQEGSTIMAAKTNPVILEYVRGLAIDCKGEALKISEYISNGNLQLNAFLPFITNSFLVMGHSLTEALLAMNHKFLRLAIPDIKRIEHNLLESNVLLNLLVAEFGYNRIKEIYNALQNSANKPKTIDELKSFICNITQADEKKIAQYFSPARIAAGIRGKL